MTKETTTEEITFECKNPAYAAGGTGRIDLEWRHPDYGWIPFTADPSDTEEHGRAIYAAAVRGDFGEVRQPSDAEVKALTAGRARAQRNRLLSDLDVIVGNPLRWASFTQEQQSEAAAYRQALLDVPQQPGFPLDIVWPTVPDFV